MVWKKMLIGLIAGVMLGQLVTNAVLVRAQKRTIEVMIEVDTNMLKRIESLEGKNQ